MNQYYEMYMRQTKELVVDPLKKIAKQFSILKVTKGIVSEKEKGENVCVREGCEYGRKTSHE